MAVPWSVWVCQAPALLASELVWCLVPWTVDQTSGVRFGHGGSGQGWVRRCFEGWRGSPFTWGKGERRAVRACKNIQGDHWENQGAEWLEVRDFPIMFVLVGGNLLGVGACRVCLAPPNPAMLSAKSTWGGQGRGVLYLRLRIEVGLLHQSAEHIRVFNHFWTKGHPNKCYV